LAAGHDGGAARAVLAGTVVLGIAVLASLASPWLASRAVADAYAALEAGSTMQSTALSVPAR
jgi:hypothetical protein